MTKELLKMSSRFVKALKSLVTFLIACAAMGVGMCVVLSVVLLFLKVVSLWIG